MNKQKETKYYNIKEFLNRALKDGIIDYNQYKTYIDTGEIPIIK